MNVATNEDARFRISDGVLTTASPLIKGALSVLGPRWPEAMSVEDLIAEMLARHQVPPERSEASANNIAITVGQSFIRHVVELFSHPPHVRASIPEFPRTSPLARLQVAVHPHVTTQLHEIVKINPFGRRLIMLADGSRDRAGLYAGLLEAVQAGELVMVDKAGQPQSNVAVEPALERALDDGLKDLLRLGLICA